MWVDQYHWGSATIMQQGHVVRAPVSHAGTRVQHQQCIMGTGVHSLPIVEVVRLHGASCLCSLPDMGVGKWLQARKHGDPGSLRGWKLGGFGAAWGPFHPPFMCCTYPLEVASPHGHPHQSMA